MALHRTQALVTGRRGLGESDRLVDFYARDFGKLRGVARSARRPRSRFGSALEPFTLGELIFFDTGRSELVRVDHFDIVHPFRALHESLERLGRAAWTVECVTRLSADRDPHPALFRLLVHALRALESRPARRGSPPALPRAPWTSSGTVRGPTGASCAVGPHPFPSAVLDVAAGGLLCGRCRSGADALPLSGAALAAFKRLRELRWEESLRLSLAPLLEAEVTVVIEGVIARLAGQMPRSTRFLTQVRRSLSRVAEPAPSGRPR